jgi:putative endonuclease
LGKQYFVYMMTNKWNTALYTGVTGDLRRRVYQHKEGLIEGFTRRYRLRKLVYYEVHRDVWAAIGREKRLKGGSRAKKMAAIEAMNPEWRDLYPDVCGEG